MVARTMGVSITMGRMTRPAGASFAAEAIRSAQRGEASARDDLARSCFRTAYSFALQLTGHRQDAKDLAQEAVIRVLRSLGRFDPGRSFTPWLLTIVRNLARDRARRAAHRLNRSLDESGQAIVPGLEDPADGPEATAARRQLEQRVLAALLELPPAQREIIALRDYHDLSYEQIARVLGIPRGTVMSRLHRARRALAGRVAGTTTKGGPS